MPKSTCAVARCDQPTKARGWCKTHYNRWHYSGEVEPWASPTLECVHCGGKVVQVAPGVPPKYCSKACRSRAGHKRRMAAGLKPKPRPRKIPVALKCVQCDAAFESPRKGARFCSPRCGKRYANAAWRANRGTCSADECDNRAVARGFCRQHHPSASGWSRNGNPETRRANLRRKTQQRRARTKGDPNAELIDRDEIGNRDAWRCGLCSARIDRTLPYPHPRSASLDHIEPLSLGGKHIKANVQISHLACNVAKGNRGGGEQLLLIG